MSEKQEIVIVGAGIMGVCTAYYLTQHQDYSPSTHHITLIEACRPAAGASGKAGGLLALWAFPEELVPLSFKLHQELADEYNGYEEWEYRRVSTLQISGGEGVTKPCKNVPPELDWVRRDLIDDCEPLGGPDVTAQVQPWLFTNFLLKKCQEKGVELVIGKVEEICKADGKVCGVEYTTERGGAKHTHHASKVIVTAGPWTSKVVNCPISGMRAHSITIDPGQKVSAFALFTDLAFKANNKTRLSRAAPEIYARKNEVYVCGEGDQSVALPEYASDVEVDQSKCDEIFSHACVISDELKNGTRKRSQACYLPVAPHSSPLLGETSTSGLYVTAGHSCWGINNGPGTGKVMSEIVMDGKASSAKLDADFDPKSF